MLLKAIFISLVSLLAVLIEVINPHSFLNSSGAFVRAGAILIGLPVWIWISKKENKYYLVFGGVVMMVTAISYLLYGISSLCQETYYEKHKGVNAIEEPYNCKEILLRLLFERRRP